MQLGKYHGRPVGLLDVKPHARMLFREPLDHLAEECQQRLRATDANFPRRRIGDELDVANALAELVERRVAARQQRLAVAGRNDALGGPVEQPDAERVLKITATETVRDTSLERRTA